MAPATGPSRGSFAGLGIAVSVAAALLLASIAALPLIGSAEPLRLAAPSLTSNRPHHSQAALSESVDRALCESAPASRDPWSSVEAVRITDVSDVGRRIEVPLVSSCVRLQMSAAQPERSPPPTRSGRVL